MSLVETRNIGYREGMIGRTAKRVAQQVKQFVPPVREEDRMKIELYKQLQAEKIRGARRNWFSKNWDHIDPLLKEKYLQEETN